MMMIETQSQQKTSLINPVSSILDDKTGQNVVLMMVRLMPGYRAAKRISNFARLMLQKEKLQSFTSPHEFTVVVLVVLAGAVLPFHCPLILLLL